MRSWRGVRCHNRERKPLVVLFQDFLPENDGMQRFFYIVLFAGMLCGLAATMGSAAEPVKGVTTSLPEKITFNRHVAPLVFEQCSTCHRPGVVAPFSLLSFATWAAASQTCLMLFSILNVSHS